MDIRNELVSMWNWNKMALTIERVREMTFHLKTYELEQTIKGGNMYEK